jgi:diguanylate cyclase (GGDEF)-like protein/putative nucleotidyltransferase with HDIG domain
VGIIPTPIGGPREPGGDDERRVSGGRRAFDPGLANAARAQALLGGGGAVVGIISVLLPHSAELNELGMVLVQSSSIALAIWLWFWAGRIPRWVLVLTPAFGTVSISAVVYFSGDGTSAYALYYLWIAIYAFYLLSVREAATQIAFAVANYAVVLFLVGGPDSTSSNAELSHFVILAGTFLAAAIPLFYLRERVERLWSRLSDAARTDLNTGLPNIRGLHEILTTELERARLATREVTVLVADLDRFKEVERRLGRDAADDLLRRIGALLNDCTRRMDTVAITGPNQFTIVLPETSVGDAYIVAEQILARIRRGSREEGRPLTVSIGIASYPSAAITVEELLRVSDQALRAAKKLGRDRAVVFSDEVGAILAGTAEEGPRGVGAQSHLATMLSLAETLDLRDATTARHSQQVGEYAQLMALELGLSVQRAERVRLAGILHDIGKVAVPDEILRKEGELDEAEWEQIRRHPELGARILGTRELVDIREWVLASHECPDGTGYPRGLVGDEIPLEARILAVGDAYEAMTGGRIYRDAISEEEAKAELRACAGTQFDAEVVEALIRAIERRPNPAASP